MERQVCIYGNGGHARDVAALLILAGRRIAAFIDKEPGPGWRGIPCCGQHQVDVDVDRTEIIVAVGEPALRRKIVESLPAAARIMAPLVHPSAVVGLDVRLAEGSVVFPGCVITCDVEIGRFAILNSGTSVAHDVRVGEYFTAAPGVRLNGRVVIGDDVYFGSNASTVDGVSISSGVTVGAGACVAESLTSPGTYVGVPARRLP